MIQNFQNRISFRPILVLFQTEKASKISLWTTTNICICVTSASLLDKNKRNSIHYLDPTWSGSLLFIVDRGITTMCLGETSCYFQLPKYHKTNTGHDLALSENWATKNYWPMAQNANPHFAIVTLYTIQGMGSTKKMRPPRIVLFKQVPRAFKHHSSHDSTWISAPILVLKHSVDGPQKTQSYVGQ